MNTDNLRDKLRERFANVRRPTEVRPAPRATPSAIFKHFDTVEEWHAYLQHREDNKDVLPF